MEGRVFNAATGELVGKASLPLTRTESTAALTAADLPQSYAAASDASGKFAIRNVEPGNYRMRARAVTGQYGRFTFKNLVPGEYKVFAWEDAESGAWMDSEFMKPLEGKGESATVREGSQANVQATSIPAESGKEKAKTTEGSRP